MGQLGVSPLAVLLLRPPRRAPFLRRLLGAIHVHRTWLQGRHRRPLSGGLAPPRPRESPPRLLQPDPGGGPSQPQVLPRRHLLPLPEPLLLLLVQPPRHWKVSEVRQLQDPVTALSQALPGLPLRVPGAAPDDHLFNVEMVGEGEAWGQVGPHRGPIGGVLSTGPPPSLHHPSLQLRPAATRTPPATSPPSGSAPHDGTPHRVRHGRRSRHLRYLHARRTGAHRRGRRWGGRDRWW